MSSVVKKCVEYTKKGKKDKNTVFPQKFIDIVKKNQMFLEWYLVNELYKYYKAEDVECGEGFVFARGSIPVVVTAHMDTVHKETVKTFYEFEESATRHIISSPQGIGGDDRCGVFMILSLLELGYRPYVIFCEDEEVGGVGSRKFLKSETATELFDANIKFFIELDRANGNDLVFYEDANEDFHIWCEQVTGYKESFGSFSDISHFCPEIGVSGVNISCGYYNAHTTDEYVVWEEMQNGIEAAKKLLDAADNVDQFEYMEYTGLGYGYDYNYGYSYQGKSNKYGVIVGFYYGNGKYETIDGESVLSCIAQFLMDHPSISFNEIDDYEIISFNGQSGNSGLLYF